MPFALLVIGAVLIVSALRGTHAQLGAQLVQDMKGVGQAGFIVWVAAIVAVGALGYSPVLRTPSRMLLGLVFLSMLISNRGFFAQISQDLAHPPAAATAPALQPSQQDPLLQGSIPVAVTSSGSSGGSVAAGGILGGVFGGIAKAITGAFGG